MKDYSTLNDSCIGDDVGLRAALGEDFEVLWEDGWNEGYGHHGSNAIFRTSDDRFIHANCGGCSCDGYGDWDYCESEADAWRHVPEQDRPEGM